VTIEGGGSGAIVMSVDPKGPGAAANIHQGDVLVSWDGKPLSKLRPLLRSLGPDGVGKLAAIELRERRPDAPDQTSNRLKGRRLERNCAREIGYGWPSIVADPALLTGSAAILADVEGLDLVSKERRT
jgi:hypothetical protein